MLLKESLKYTLKGWRRNPLNTFISFISFTVGITCTLILMMFVIGELRMARSMNDLNGVYIMEEVSPFNRAIRRFGSDPGETPEYMDKYPEIEDYVMVHNYTFQVDRKEGNNVKYGMFHSNYQATPSFADIFPMKIVEGDLKKTLSSPDEIAITTSFAKRVFDSVENPVGRILTYDRSIMDENGRRQTLKGQTLTITTLIDDSEKTIFDFGSLSYLTNDDWNRSGHTGTFYSFFKLSPGTDPHELEEKINRDNQEDMIEKNRSTHQDISLIPLGDIYFSESDRYDFLRRQDRPMVNTGMILAVVIMIIACFNYINLTLTRATARLKMIAAQRIVGAMRWNIRFDIVVETFLQIAICFAASVYLAGVVLPLFNEFMEMELKLSELLRGDNMVAMIVFITLITMLPAIYIIVKMERSSVLSIAKSAMTNKSQLVKNMVIAQFVMSITLIIVTINIGRQMGFISRTRPNADNIIRVYDNDRWRDPQLRDAILASPYVIESTMNGPTTAGSVAVNGQSSNMVNTDSSYLAFYELELIEGRFFSNFEDEAQTVVNETFFNKYLKDSIRVGDSIDLPITQGTKKLIGIVKDYQVENFKTTIQPLIYIPRKPGNRNFYLYLKLDPKFLDEGLESLRGIWQDYYFKKYERSNYPFDYDTLSDIYMEMHQDEIRFSTIVKFFTWMSIALTVMGLFGLAWYSVERRKKEIALRKIHGATVGQVIIILCRGFMKWIAIAAVIGMPIAYFISREWFSTFAYKIGMSPLTFLSALAIVVIIGIGTVIFQSYRAAVANPVKSIKTE